ncbi:tyrosine-protein phosphatase [Amphibacillus sp. Q70]|uniref:tyrosine-protein phosphatase n=1 Tax=Amphibacillus sp. Q70 TaxID=3453416 RepID=UPI003F83EBD4
MAIYTQPYTISGVNVQRSGDQLTIMLENTSKPTYQLYVGKTPNVEAINELIATSSMGDFTVTLPVAEGPYYFVIKAEGFQTQIFGERVIQLDGAINIRDMGGYKTNDGRVTKWGLLFRGDQLSKLTVNDIKLLEKMNLTTIVDYRSDHERTLNPNKEITTVKNTYQCDPQSSFSEAAANAIDLHSENVKLVSALKEGKVDARYINDKGENVIEDYQELITSEKAKEAYGKLLSLSTRKENVPLLHHCRGGKDRTGLGSLFLLLVLNVKEEEIIRDYVLTGIIRKERNQLKYEQYKDLTSNKSYLAYLMAMIETREVYIKASINKIKELYDSIDTYMIKHFGLTKEEIEEMRAFYLEESVER